GSDRGALRGVPSLAGLPMPKALALGLPPFRGEHALPASCLGVVSPTPFEDDETRPAVRRHARQRRPDLLRRWCRDWSFVLDLESYRGLALGHGCHLLQDLLDPVSATWAPIPAAALSKNRRRSEGQPPPNESMPAAGEAVI